MIINDRCLATFVFILIFDCTDGSNVSYWDYETVSTASEPYMICGEPAAVVFADVVSGYDIQTGVDITWTEYCQEEVDLYLDYDYTDAYDTNSTINFPPVVGGSGWALLYDGEGDAMRGSLNKIPTDAFTFMWWQQGMEFSFFHDIFNIATKEEQLLTITCEAILDVWVAGVSAVAYDFWTNFHMSNVAFPGSWVHGSISWDSSGEVLTYINGALVATSWLPNDTVLGGRDTVFTVGCICHGGDSGQSCGSFSTQTAFAGMFDEIQLYDYVLSQDQIKTSFAKGKRASPAPILDFSFNTEFGSGGIVRDESGFSSDGLLLGYDVRQLAKYVVRSDDVLDTVYWDLRDAEEGSGPTWVASTVPTIGLGDFVFSVPRDQELAVVLPAMDPDNDTLVWFIEEAPLNGTLYQTIDGVARGDVLTSGMEVSHPGGMVIYVPNQDAFDGTPMREWKLHWNVNPVRDTFVYCVNDTVGHQACSGAFVLQNLPPFARSDHVWIQEDADLVTFFPCFDQDGDLPEVVITAIEGRGYVYDHDYYIMVVPPEDVYPSHNLRAYPHDMLSMRRFPMMYGDEIVDLPFTLGDIGRRVIFSPGADESGEGYTNITYYCTDRFNQRSNVATLFIDVEETNDQPVASDISVTSFEDQTYVIALDAYDLDGDRIHFIVTSIPDSSVGTLYRVNSDLSIGAPISSANVGTDLVQYAVRIITDFDEIVNPAGMVGAPEVYPESGQSVYATEVIYADVLTIEFAYDFYVSEVWVYETKDPGAIVKVTLLTDYMNKEIVVWEGIDIPVIEDQEVRLFKPQFCVVNVPVHIVRLYIDRELTGRQNPTYDAVAMVGSLIESPNLLSNEFVAFTPAPDYYGDVDFTYIAGDCQDESDNARVSMYVRPVNDPPVIVDTANKFSPKCDEAVPLLLDVKDVDSKNLTVKVTDHDEALVFFSSSGDRLAAPFLVGEDELIYICGSDGLVCDEGENFTVSVWAWDGSLSTDGNITMRCSPPPKVETVLLGVLLPLHVRNSTSGAFERNRAGSEALAALDMAIREINNKTDGVSDDLLPITTLKYLFEDTRSNSGTAREGAQDMLAEKVDGVHVTAFFCCENDVLSKDVYTTVSTTKYTLQMSYQTTSPELSSADIYTYFYRTVPSLDDHVQLLVHVLVDMGWERCSVVYEDQTKWMLVAGAFLEEASLRSVDVVRSLQVSSTMARSRLESDLLPLKNTTMIIIFCENVCSEVLDVASSSALNMTGNGQGYTWFTISETLGSPPATWSEAMRGGFYTEICDTQQQGCTDIERPESEGGEVDCDTTVLERWRAQPPICDDIAECMCSNATDARGEHLWRTADGTECLGLSFDTGPSLYSSFLYDSVFAIATALNEIIPSTEATSVSTASLASAIRMIDLNAHTGSLRYSSSGDRGAGVCVNLWNFASPGEIKLTSSWHGAGEGYLTCDDLATQGSLNVSECETLIYATPNQIYPNAFCPDDTYLDADSVSETYKFCLPCAEGLHSYQLDMTYCSSCGDYECPQDDCSAGEYYDALLFDSCGDASDCYCVACPGGTFSPTSGATLCTPCPVGTFAPEKGLSKCVQCGDEAYLDIPGGIECLPCPANTLRKVNTDGTSVDQCICKEGYWTGGRNVTENQGCVDCVDGGYCSGAESAPVPREGYWGDPANPKQFWECDLRDRCLGNFVCERGYDGFLCGECNDDYYEIAHVCYRCASADLAWFWAICSISIEVFAWYFIYVLVSMTEMAKQVAYSFQMLWLISHVRLRWSEEVMHFFRSLGVFAFQADFYSPECSVKWSDTKETVIQYFLPVFAIVLVLPSAIISLLLGNRSSNALMSLFSYLYSKDQCPRRCQYLPVGIVLFDIVSLSAFVRAWKAFVCEDLSEGTTVLFWAPRIACGSTDHHIYIVLSVLAVLVYGVCWPISLYQVLSAGKRDGRFGDPLYCARFAYLFASYQEYWWWYFIDWGMRVAFSVVVVFGHGEPILQAVVCMFIITLALCLQVLAWPFSDRRVNQLKVAILLILFAILACGVIFFTITHEAVISAVCFLLIVGMILLGLYFVFLNIVSSSGFRGLQFVTPHDVACNATNRSQCFQNTLINYMTPDLKSEFSLASFSTRKIRGNVSNTMVTCAEGQVYFNCPTEANPSGECLPTIAFRDSEGPALKVLMGHVVRSLQTNTTENENSSAGHLKWVGGGSGCTAINTMRSDPGSVDLRSVIHCQTLMTWLVSETMEIGVVDKNGNCFGRFVWGAAETLKKTGYWMFGVDELGPRLRLSEGAKDAIINATRWLQRVHMLTGLDDAACRRAVSAPYVQLVSQYGVKDDFVLWLLHSTEAERVACARVLASRLDSVQIGITTSGAAVMVEETLAFLLYAVLVLPEANLHVIRHLVTMIEGSNSGVLVL